MVSQSIVCYNIIMSDILVAGKDLPDILEFAEGFIANKKVYTSVKKDVDLSTFESEGIYSCNWNKSSAISARNFIIKAETTLPDLSQYVVFFDTQYYASKFELDRTESVSLAVDAMFANYQLLVNEILLRLEQRKDPVVVSFLVKTYPSRFETLHSSGKTSLVPSSNIVNAAQNAFISLAENVSTLVQDKTYMSVLLAKCDPSNELYDNDHELGEWMAKALDSVAAMKSKQTAKQASQWIRPGSRVSGFSLFK